MKQWGVVPASVMLLVVSAGVAGAVCTGTVFSDVNSGTVSAEFCEAIETLANMSVVQGFPDGTYRPYSTVTRGAMAAFFTRTIKHFGGLSVAPSQAPRTNLITTLDSTGTVGAQNSIAIGTDGFPVISYRDSDSGGLKVAKCGDLACLPALATVWSIDTGDVWATSITVGTDGFPVISYYAGSGEDLRVAKCGDDSCSPARVNRHTFDASGVVGDYTSITIGADGFPVVSYYDATNGNLKVAKCGNASCTSRSVVTADPSPNDVGAHTSIAIGTDGFPVICYHDGSAGLVKFAKCNASDCSTASIMPVDIGRRCSVVIGRDGLPVMSYYDHANSYLKVVKCGDPTCTVGSFSTVDADGDVGMYNSIAIGADGFPVIAYFDLGSGKLKVAKCHDDYCASAAVTTADSAGNAGQTLSLTIGTDGLPVISYYAATGGDLRVLKCANQYCLNNWWRR